MPVDRSRRILDERTARLARRPDATQADGPVLELLTFSAGRELYGMESRHVAAILPGRSYVPVAGAPPALRGLFGQSGRLVSALDLAVLMGILPVPDRSDAAGPGHLLLLRHPTLGIALHVDRVRGTTSLPATAVTTVEAEGRGPVLGHWAMPAETSARTLSLLDPGRLLSPLLPAFSASGV